MDLRLLFFTFITFLHEKYIEQIANIFIQKLLNEYPEATKNTINKMN